MKALGKPACLILIALSAIAAHWATAAPPIQVTAADPSAAPQGTLSLDVTVSGSGFDSSATASFFVTGTTNSGGVTVKKVTVKGSKQLIATIDIAENAVVDKFDIEVSLSGGRKGKGTTLFSVQAKGKPTEEPPPLPPPGSCAGAPGVFPAFAYDKARYHTERKGRLFVYDGSDLYIANSTGSCSVKLLIENDSRRRRVSYRQIGNEVLIAWAKDSEIKLLRLPVDNGYVVPIQPVIVYTNQDRVPMSVDLSKDGRTIYFKDSYRPADQQNITTVKSIDITSCTANCTPQDLYTFPINIFVGGLSINDAGDRLYMTISESESQIKSVSFLQKQAGEWTFLRHVVSNSDSPYSSIRGFEAPEIGRWDYQSSSVPKDVLAFVMEGSNGDRTIEIMDVSNCSATGTGSCYGSGESILIRSGIPGRTASFTSAPATADPAPNLLIVDGSYENGTQMVLELDPDSMTLTPLLEGHDADSAD